MEENLLLQVTMILYDSLWLYPPIVILSRRPNEDTVLGDLSLLDGVLVSILVILGYHDEEIWGEDEKKFKPKRFRDRVSSATKGQVPFLPFIYGPRICIGQNFSMIEEKMALAMIMLLIRTVSILHTCSTFHNNYATPIWCSTYSAQTIVCTCNQCHVIY